MILYIGNKLSKHGNTPTGVDTLGEKLSIIMDVLTVSNKKNKIIRLFDMLFSIIKYAKKIDTILIDTYSTSNFYFAFLSASLARLLSLKYIPILHGGNLPNRLEKSPFLSKTIFKNSLINIAPSGYLFEAFKQKNYNVTYIPNSININEYPFKKRDTFSPKLLYVRAFSTIYNPLLAIEVLEKLQIDYPHATLCMVGPDRDGTLEKVKKECQIKGLAESVIFTGKLSKEEWTDLSIEYDIFINTTNFDNTPVSLIEAMALGLPVVTTNVGGIPYLIEDGLDGLTVPPCDASAMVEKIDFLLSTPLEVQNMVQNARKKAESYDWEIVKKEWLKILKDEK